MFWNVNAIKRLVIVQAMFSTFPHAFYVGGKRPFIVMSHNVRYGAIA